MEFEAEGPLQRFLIGEADHQREELLATEDSRKVRSAATDGLR
jgi:hypothetical protein